MDCRSGTVCISRIPWRGRICLDRSHTTGGRMESPDMSTTPSVAPESLPATTMAAHASRGTPVPKTRIVAAGISAVLPGAGHVLIRRFDRALAFFVGLLVLVALLWPTRVAAYFPAMMVCGFAWMALYVTSTWSALRISSPIAEPGLRSWLILLVPLALFACSKESDVAIRASGFRMFT